MPELLGRLQSALADRYRLDREVGAGGMATVYLAQDIRHDRRVALKVLRPELAAVIGAERFLAEIKLTANLQHPHILPLFDSGEADGYLFYVMPFIEGETLRDRLNREKQLPVADASGSRPRWPRRSTTRTGTAWSTATSSPRTSCCTTARRWWPTSASRSRPARPAGARMTETGMSLGTPHYMSPEQAMGEREITGPLRRLRARRRALRDAHGRPAVHRLHRAGGRGARGDREPAAAHHPAPHDPAATSRRRC